MITTILFDAGGTLVMPNFVRMAAELARDGVEVAPAALERAEIALRFDFDTQSYVAVHRDPWLNYMLGIAERAGLGRTLHAAFERLRHYHDTQNLWEEVIPGTETALAVLSQSFRLGVVSNANGTVRKSFERLGLATFFATIVDSGEVGLQKPDPRIFRYALEAVAAQPSEVLYVGDIFSVDVVGARSAGLRGVLLDPQNLHDAKPCERIGSLGELAERLGA